MVLLPHLIRPYWDEILLRCDLFNFGPRWQIATIIIGTTLLTFIINNIYYLIIYASNIPAFEKHRTNTDQPWPWKDPSEEIRRKFYINCRTAIFLTFFNVLCVGFPLALLGYDTMVAFGTPIDSASFESPLLLAVKIVVAMIVDDAIFYTGHALLHTKFLYAPIHKMHHSWNYTLAIAVMHLHPIEFALCNVVPNVGSMVVTRAHLFTMCLWYHLRVLQTMEAHSNYSFPWAVWGGLGLPSSHGEHEKHHSKNTGNYGSFLYAGDTMFGTTIEVASKNATTPMQTRSKSKLKST